MIDRKYIAIVTLSLTATLFTGCSNQKATLVSPAVNNGVNGSLVNPSSVVASAASHKGLAQSQLVGAKMMMNPAVVGVGAVGMAISKKNEAENKASYGKLSTMMADPDKANNSMENLMVKSYNQKYNTNFRTMDELKDFTRVGAYNKQKGTDFKTFGQLRKGYNAKEGTNFKNNKEFRAYLDKESER